MATPIVMPSFGMYTAEGTVANWVCANGAPVKRGEVVLEIETEKAVNPVISPADGILSHSAATGTVVKEEGLLGYILAEGESAPAACGAALEAAIPGISKQDETAAGGLHGGDGDLVKASPAARKLARQHKIDLKTVAGSGPGGRIVEADIKAAAGQERGTPGASGSLTRSGEGAPLSALRRSIGERLRRTLDTAVSLTITREVEAGGLVKARKVLAERLKVPVPYDALFLRLLGAALRENPDLNVVIENDRLRACDTADVCFAIAVPGGLVAPVVRDADKATFVEMVARMRRLTEQARSNSLRSEDISGGSSTVTNLGADGVDVFTPILNPPQATILGVGRIAERPIAKNGAVAAVQTCWLSLTFDHRVTDGVPAAKLLESIAKRMAEADYLCSLV